MTTTRKTRGKTTLLPDPDGPGLSDLPPGFGPIQRPCPDGTGCPEFAVHGGTGQVLLWESTAPDTRVLLDDRDAARLLGQALADL